ncbi:MAG: hypothetical protein DRQ46_10380 [Gammaproteobacteria bacterium]|nr:MAG: hypothetical protein DRQ46_10380 [Gammaproteobacteria bacterium]
MRYLAKIINITRLPNGKYVAICEVHDTIEYSNKAVEIINEKGEKEKIYPSIASGKIATVTLEFSRKPTAKQIKAKLDKIVKQWREQAKTPTTL